MTDSIPSSDDARDELVSAVLDGEADAAARAQVEADPTLRARLEELRAVRDLVAAPVAPLDTVTAARLRRAAIRAEHPAATAQRSHVGRWLLSAAAVLLLIALAIPVLGSLDGVGDNGDAGGDDQATASLESADDEAMPDSLDAATADGGDAGEAAPDDRPWLGVFDSDHALATAAVGPIVTAAGQPPRTEAESTLSLNERSHADAAASAADACPLDAGDDLVETSFGQVGDEARLVRLVERDGAMVALVLDPVTCALLATAER